MEMAEIKTLAIEVSKKHGKAYSMELIDLVIMPAIEVAVKSSPTPIDDVIFTALKNPIRDALKSVIEGL